MSIALLASAGKGAAPKLYVEDVFSAYLHIGNDTTQTINNGIDLANKGGMTWLKRRDGVSSHRVFDTIRGIGNQLYTDVTNGQGYDGSSLTGFLANGFSLGSSGSVNGLYSQYVSWTFRKSPKFFDIVTWTGDGVAGRQIPHNLGCEVGMIIVKGTNTAGDQWSVYHRGMDATLAERYYMFLNATTARDPNINYWNNTAPTTTNFTVGGGTYVNTVGHDYVAYLYAHDTSADGIIQCGSFTTDGFGNATVNLGWEPQYLMIKSTNAVDGWYILDCNRGFDTNKTSKVLFANTSAAEVGTWDGTIRVNSRGFSLAGAIGININTIYLAIRRPNKVPTSGTEVYNAIARTGTGAVATVTGVGFAPDLVLIKNRDVARSNVTIDRLRGTSLVIRTQATNAELACLDTVTFFNMDGISIGVDSSTNAINNSGEKIINHFFKRAKGFMDIVCEAGTFATNQRIAHNLGVIPELIIHKGRNRANYWRVYFGNISTSMYLNGADIPVTTANQWGTALPTATDFGINSGLLDLDNFNGVFYLFATLAGISKVGSYTGNGTSINLDMGFTTGARFFLVKRTDSTGDWYIFDTVRGIVSANDPHLSLNTTAAEVTIDDSVDPYSLGLTVNQVAATNINVNSASYIYLAIA